MPKMTVKEILATKHAKPGRKTKAHQGNSGVILAFDPSQQQAQEFELKTDGAVNWRDMHMTLIYLGKMEDLAPYKAKILRVAQILANHCQPFTAKTNGMATFSKQQSNGTYASVALIDSPQFPKIRTKAEALLSAMGVPYHVEHGLTPHITLAYTPLSSLPRKLPPQLDLNFDTIRVYWGDDVVSFPMGGDHTHAGSHHDRPQYAMKHAKHDQRTHGYRFGSNASMSYIRGMQKRHGRQFREDYIQQARIKKGDTRFSRVRDHHRARILVRKRVEKISKVKDPQKRLDMLNKLVEERDKSKFPNTRQMMVAQEMVRAKRELRKRAAGNPKPKQNPIQKAKSSFPSNGEKIQVSNSDGWKGIRNKILDKITTYKKPTPFTMIDPSGREKNLVAVYNRKNGKLRFSTVEGDYIYYSSIGRGGKFTTESRASIEAALGRGETPESGFYLQDTGLSSKEKTLYQVPKKVKQNATKGLSLRYGLGGTDYFGSMQIAHELIKGQVDFDTLSGMWDFWNNQADHYKNEAIELMWGGDAGMAWVNGLMRRAEKPAYKHGKHNQIVHGNRYGKAPSLARARQLRKAGELSNYTKRARERSGTKPRKERGSTQNQHIRKWGQYAKKLGKIEEEQLSTQEALFKSKPVGVSQLEIGDIVVVKKKSPHGGFMIHAGAVLGGTKKRPQIKTISLNPNSHSFPEGKFDFDANTKFHKTSGHTLDKSKSLARDWSKTRSLMTQEAMLAERAKWERENWR